MIAGLAIRTRSRHAAVGTGSRRPTRPLPMLELERLLRGAAAEHVGDAPLTLLSLTCADDGRYVEIECGIDGDVAVGGIDRAAVAVASAVDPVALGATAAATVRVRFAPGALA